LPLWTHRSAAAVEVVLGERDRKQEEKAAEFRTLHEGEPFLIPNPWDAGSAKVLAALGFNPLATTSSGFTFTLGRPDGEATLDEVIEHVGMLDRATRLPVSVDLENGHGPDPEDAASAIARPRPARSAARSRTTTRAARSTASTTQPSESPRPPALQDVTPRWRPA
jgi:Phosphoenolpyruvate phosphomutase